MTLEDFVKGMVAEIGKEDEFLEYKSVSTHRRESYSIEGNNAELHRTVPDSRWPKRLAFQDELSGLFLAKVRDEGWEVESIQSNRPAFLETELEHCALDIYNFTIRFAGATHSSIHLTRKQVDFEEIIAEQVEIEAARTAPGEFTLPEIFDRALKRCNSPFEVRENTKERIISNIKIDKAHRKPGPKPKRRRTN